MRTRNNKNVNGYRLHLNERVTPLLDNLQHYPDLNMYYTKYKKELNIDNMFFTEGVSGAIKNIFEILKPSNYWTDSTFALYPIFDKLYSGNGPSIAFPIHPNNNISELCEKYDHIVIDDVYQHFSYKNWEEYLKYPNVTIMRSFSKAYGLAAIRLGYVTGELTELLAQNRGGYEANTLSLDKGLYYLKHKDIMLNYVNECLKSLEYLKQFDIYNYDGYSNSVTTHKIEKYDILLQNGYTVAIKNNLLRITLAPLHIIKEVNAIILKV